MRFRILKYKISFEAWIMYYLILGIIQALWTDPSSFPPQLLRIAMIAAVFGPIIFRREIILLAIPFSMTLRAFLSTPYSFLPDLYSYEFYIYVLLISMAIHYKKLNFSLYRKMKPLIAMMLCFAIVDVLYNGEIGNYATNIFIGLLLVPFIQKEDDFHLLSVAVLAASALLAIYYLIMYDSFLAEWESSGIERSGWSDPNYFAIMLDCGMLVAIMYLWGCCKSKLLFFDKKILVVSCLFCAVSVFMTASRGGFLCMVFIIMLAILSAKLKFKHFILVFLFIVAVGVYVYSNGMMELLIYRFFEEGSLDTGNNRVFIWKLVLENFSDQDIVQQLFGGGYWHRAELAQDSDAHNEFLSIMADYGLMGLLLYLLFFKSMVSFNRGSLLKQNITVIFYFLSVALLSPFQYIYTMFLIVWIYAHKFNNEGLLMSKSNE